MLLQQIISQSFIESYINDIENITLIATGGVDITITSCFWFGAYRTSEHPNITCDKDYFFLWSTDHDNSGGAIYWGKGNNLDGSDFVEVGLVKSGYQSETPFPFTQNGKFYLLYHTVGNDPSNTNGIQETRLMSMTSGELHTAIWTDEGNPLGFNVGETHTGYCKVFSHPVHNLLAVHLSVGGTSAEYKFSKGSDITDLSNRIGVVDLTSFMPDGYEIKASYGTYFNLYGRYWAILTIEPFEAVVGTLDKNCVVVETDIDLNITRLVTVLNNGENTRNYEAHIEGTTAHIYFQNPANLTYHGTLDLTFLQTL